MIVRPFKNGLLYSHELTSAVVSAVVSAVKTEDKLRCVLGLPSDILPKQERELYRMLREAGVTECCGVTRSVAALIGAGYSPSMSVISVNVGASLTDISVLHGGRVILSDTASIGGEDFDRAVKDYILNEGDVNISLSVARAIKERLGAVWQGRPKASLELEGTLSLTGNHVGMTVSTEDFLGVFKAPLQVLLRAMADVIKKIPYELVEPIFQNGIVLTGGGAELFGLAKMVEKVLDISTKSPDDPIDSVAKGLSRINAIIPARTKVDGKNVTAQLAKYYEAKMKKTTSKQGE